jgi:hypothetical protein
MIMLKDKEVKYKQKTNDFTNYVHVAETFLGS